MRPFHIATFYLGTLTIAGWLSTGCSDTTNCVELGNCVPNGYTSAAGGNDTGGNNAAGECIPGQTACDGLDVQTCDQDGQWQVSETCPYICAQGACTGECELGSNQCDGNNVQICEPNGQWQTTSTCPFVCQGGACSGSCVPSTQQCDGVVPQTCDSNGQWVNGTACEFGCTAGSCTGNCTPGDTICNGTMLQTCDSNGAWQNTLLCPSVCQNAACTGVCSPGTAQCAGNTVETCDVNGLWQVVTPCPFVCSAGACRGVCTPGAVECDGIGTKTCNAQGQWDAIVPCNDTGGTPTCQMGVCGITCDPTHADCANGAVDGCETTLGTPSDCSSCNDSCNTPPANAVGAGVCDSIQQGCGFTCLPGWEDCANGLSDGCEQDVTSDPWNCGGCGISCHGGTCLSGTCVEGIEKVTGTAAVTSLTLGVQDVFWTEAGGNVAQAAKAGGGPVVLASGETSPQAAVTDGVNVIWSNVGANIRAVPIDGGITVTLVAGHGPLELAHDGVDLWWTDQINYMPCLCSMATVTNVWKVGLGGGAPPVIHNTQQEHKVRASWPGLVVDANHVYRARWMGPQATSDIYFHDKSMADAQPWVSMVNGSGFNAASHLVISPDGTKKAWRAGTLWNWIYFMDGNGPDEVANMQGVVVDMVIDNANVYYIRATNSELQAKRTIYKKALAAGVPGLGMVLADNQYAADHIKVDGTHVYWATGGYKFDDLPPASPMVAETVVLRAPK